GRPADGQGQDLRGAILPAELRQLEAAGSPEKVTVGAIIDEAGGTPPSLHHYWPKRELLLREVSERGWALFRVTQSGASAECDDPVERLRVRGRAYLDFALARPALLRVLFVEAPAGPSGSPATLPPRPVRGSMTWSPTSRGPWPPGSSGRPIRPSPHWPCGLRCTKLRRCGQSPRTPG
ncbi:MAG: TetR/AcrR family transcriptional regulator, partial [Dermatophilaceae bacterium]|nr:TetR/AcrR family transcriptional regulator [Dermatophilaceae bacterium]